MQVDICQWLQPGCILDDLLHAPQVTLGITTLMTCVPPSLGSAHQAGALTLVTLVLALLHTLRRAPGSVAKQQSFVRRNSTALAATGVLGIGAAVTLER